MAQTTNTVNKIRDTVEIMRHRVVKLHRNAVLLMVQINTRKPDMTNLIAKSSKFISLAKTLNRNELQQFWYSVSNYLDQHWIQTNCNIVKQQFDEYISHKEKLSKIGSRLVRMARRNQPQVWKMLISEYDEHILAINQCQAWFDSVDINDEISMLDYNNIVTLCMAKAAKKAPETRIVVYILYMFTTPNMHNSCIFANR